MLFNLDKNSQRPMIILSNNSMALLDTGADIPVWVGNEYILQFSFHAKLVKRDISFKGFGGRANGNLYRIPQFILGDLIYPNLPIITVYNENKPFQMILSATMFSNLIYEINDKDKFLNIKIPKNVSNIRHLEVKDSNGNLYILCTDN